MEDHNLSIKIGTELDEESVRRLTDKLKTELEKVNTKESDKAYREATRAEDKEKAEQSKTYKQVTKDLKEYDKQNKKGTDFFKNWRKTLTGVLIDLHWMRILASQSKVMSMNITLLGRSLGYLLDMILLPMMPAMIALSRLIISIAQSISKLPAPLRSLVTMIGSTALLFITMMTALSLTHSLYKRINLQLVTFSANLSRSNKMFGAGGAVSAGPVGIGLLIGIIGVAILHQSGSLDKIYKLGVDNRKYLKISMDKVALYLLWIVGLVGAVVGFLAEFKFPEINVGELELPEFIKRFIDTLHSLIERVKEIWSRVKEVFEPLLEKVREFKEKIIELLEPLRTLKEKILSEFSTLKDAILEKFSGVKEAVIEKFSGIKELLLEKFSGIRELVADKFSGVKEAILDRLLPKFNVWDYIREKFFGEKTPTTYGAESKVTTPEEYVKMKTGQSTTGAGATGSSGIGGYAAGGGVFVGLSEILRGNTDVMDILGKSAIGSVIGAGLGYGASKSPLIAMGLRAAGPAGILMLLSDMVGRTEKNDIPETEDWMQYLPQMASGGYIKRTGAVVLHSGETVTPKGSPSGVTVNLTVNGSMDNRTIDEVIRKLKLELGRVRG
jgi:hypothetical protein